MQNRHVEIVHRQIVRYLCGCTTTRIEIRRLPGEIQSSCTGHNSPVVSEETSIEYLDVSTSEALSDYPQILR